MLQFPLTVKLAGVSFAGAQENIKAFGSPDTHWLALVREPGNAHDPNAIRVVEPSCERYVGYIPRKMAEELAPLMDAGRRLAARFVCLNRHPRHARIGLTVRILAVAPGAAVNQKSLKGETPL